jgi:hypothetical protein
MNSSTGSNHGTDAIVITYGCMTSDDLNKLSTQVMKLEDEEKVLVT